MGTQPAMSNIPAPIMWASAAIVLLIVGFFIIRFFMKRNMGSYNLLHNIQKVQTFSALQKKGVITDAEYRQIREVLVRKTIEQIEISGAEQTTPSVATGGFPAEVLAKEIVPQSPTPKKAANAKKKSQSAINIDTLLAKGLIDEAEFERLKNIEQKK